MCSYVSAHIWTRENVTYFNYLEMKALCWCDLEPRKHIGTHYAAFLAQVFKLMFCPGSACSVDNPFSVLTWFTFLYCGALVIFGFTCSILTAMYGCKKLIYFAFLIGIFTVTCYCVFWFVYGYRGVVALNLQIICLIY